MESRIRIRIAIKTMPIRNTGITEVFPLLYQKGDVDPAQTYLGLGKLCFLKRTLLTVM